MATESHSAQFGLTPQDKPTQNAGRGPGSGIEGTTGVKGHKNSTATSSDLPNKQSTVAGLAEPGPASGSDRPGAGGSTMTPSQGSNKNADESGGLLNKLNPLK